MSLNTSLNEFMVEAQARAEAALNARLPAEAKLPERLHQAMRYSTLGGGKRLRPLLVIAGAEIGGASPEAVMPLACAVVIGVVLGAECWGMVRWLGMRFERIDAATGAALD